MEFYCLRYTDDEVDKSSSCMDSWWTMIMVMVFILTDYIRGVMSSSFGSICYIYMLNLKLWQVHTMVF